MLGNVLPQQILVLDKGEDNHTVKFLLEDYTLLMLGYQTGFLISCRVDE